MITTPTWIARFLGAKSLSETALSLLHVKPIRLNVIMAVFSSVLMAMFEVLSVFSIFPLVTLIEGGSELLYQRIPLFKDIDVILIATIGMEINLMILCSIILLLMVANRTMQFINAVNISISGQKITTNLRNIIFDVHIYSSNMSRIMSNKGTIPPLIMEQCFRSGQFSSSSIGILCRAIPICIFLMGMIYINVLAVSIIILLSALILIFSRILSANASKSGQDITKAQVRLYWLIDELIALMRETKLSTSEDRSSAMVRNHTDKMLAIEKRIIEQKSFMDAISQTLFFTLIILSILVVSSVGDSNIAMISVIGLMGARIMPHVAGINALKVDLLQSYEAIKPLRSQYEALSNYIDCATKIALSHPKCEKIEKIELDNVSYFYDDNVPDSSVSGFALKGISFTWNLSGCLAVVGASGSGKSTLADVITSLATPSCGSIKYNGKDISNWTLKTLRSNFGFVAQQPILLDGTVEENIRFRLSYLPDYIDIQAAFDLANVDFLSATENELNRSFGYRGEKLSGGQRQRLALALEFLQNNRIVILDEPSSALDDRSEEKLFEAISNLKRDKAVILITHSKELLPVADQVLVLDRGESLYFGNSKNPDLEAISEQIL